MKYYKSRVLIIIVITLILIVSIGLTISPTSGLNAIGDMISVPFTAIEKLFAYTELKIQEGVGLFSDISELRQENKSLKAEIDKLNNERVEYERLQSENENFKNALDMKSQFTDFDFLGANVIGRDSGNWFNIFLVDQGSTKGVEYNMPVITSKGLVGKVSASQPFSSKIMSIIEDGSAVSAVVAKTRDYVVVKGDVKLAKEGLCKLEYLPADIDLTQGDYIETSGVGGIYPKGIIIGRVKEVRAGDSDIDKYAIIEPAVDFKRLSEVIILKNKNYTPDNTSEEMDNTDK